MKKASDQLRAILGSDQFYMADCYTFTLVDGTVARFTTADQSLANAGRLFLADGPRFARSKIKFQVGVQVDELELDVYPRPTDMIAGVSWLQALRSGVFDGAELQLDRAFMASFGDISAGLLTMFTGRIAEIDAGRTSATVKVNTHLELLTQQFPRRLFQSGCSNTLYDTRCGLTKAGFGHGATVGAGSTASSIVTDLSDTPPWATLGTISFTSGTLSGKSFSIRDQVDGILLLTVPAPVPPAAGDNCIVYPGCDKTQATCQAKFNNLANFTGFPYVPVPETAV